MWCFFFFQAEDGIRDLVRSRGLGDVYKRQSVNNRSTHTVETARNFVARIIAAEFTAGVERGHDLSLIHI